jgi:hypothetical protein
MSPSDRHQDVWELLPWYVNGTLGGQELASVGAHLRGCPECQEEVARCQLLATAVRVDQVADAPVPRIDRVLASIDALEATRVSRGSWWQRLRLPFGGFGDLLRGTPGPMRWTVGVQTALVVLLLALATWPGSLGPGPRYRTLAERDQSRKGQAMVRLVFADDATERDIRTLLGRVEGRIVDGPSTLGAYTVALTARGPDGVAAMLALLRADPHVRLAEPVRSR